MDTRQLRAFLAVARERSFTKAAVLLDYAQSSITAQVGSLEDELKVKLFERLGRKVIPTRDGERFMMYAEKILKLFSEVREEMSETSHSPRGTLIIGAPETLSSFRLVPLIQEFHRLYPAVKIVVKKCRGREIPYFLGNNEVDVAFYLGREIYSPEIVTEILAFEQMALVSGPGGPEAGKIPFKTGDIQGQPLVLCEEGCGYRVVLEKVLSDAGVRPGRVLEFGSVEAIKKCVIQGLGITLLPRMAVEGEIYRGELLDLCWEEPEFDMNIQVVYHKDKWMSPVLSTFLNMSREVLSAGAG